jgi:hypothetical protein
VSKAFVVRYEMRPDTADENQRLVENVFAELAEKQPDGIAYACFRLDDGETFVHVGISSDDSNALGETAAFQEFQKAFGERAATKPVASGAKLVGAYGFDRQA